MTTSLSPDFRSLSRQPPTDPDIHATLSDFLTYTEHFPSHLTRALTLITSQRALTEARIKSIHDATTTYSHLPTLPKHDRPDPVKLRRDISHALEEAERACRMAVVEAARLDETCTREARRLDIVTEKLKAQPLPPSRDPTPEQTPQALSSPNLKRERRMSTRGADDTHGKPEKGGSRILQDKAATKLRGRRIMVPGEVLPPPDPNAPAESMSDWTSPLASPPVEDLPAPLHTSTLLVEKSTASRATATPRPRSRTPKPPKPRASVERGDKKAQPHPKPRGPRAPGQPGTNAHSAVAGISTSNALLALTQPPDDAVKGSKWLPWMKLTEWEMAKLRKRMKKNAIWVPSQTMVRRELKNLGRGTAGKEAARRSEVEGGDAFVDESGETDPTKVVISGEEVAGIEALLGREQFYVDEGGEDADQELINRGMRLNEAKKLKRLRMLEEQELLKAQIDREQGVDVGAASAAGDGKRGGEGNKKRKRDSTPSNATTTALLPAETPDPLSKPGPAPKKLKISTSSSTTATTQKIPLSSSPKSSTRTNRRAATPPTNKPRPTLVLKTRGKAVSEEPPSTTSRRAALRRASNISLPGSSALTSPKGERKAGGTGGGRKRKPAPGILTNGADGDGAKVGVSKRKSAPVKKSRGSGGQAALATLPETSATGFGIVGIGPGGVPGEEYLDIDPSEPRYCLCGDVSWGTMIACDNEASCEREWFHLSCVGLEDLPPRRTKWYCPDCRRKLRVGGKDGVVGRGAGR